MPANNQDMITGGEPVVALKNVSKRFELTALKDRVINSIFRRRKNKSMWALRNVDIEVQRGETVGIIGQNGSGKSTLLKIICSVYTATEGEIKVDGKIASLIELGAGFNPDFSGRDNIYFQGYMDGLTTEEIDQMYDEIVDFSELSGFMETLVKYYSSGMFVRLAFAYAIHSRADILIIDEALGVGDAKFQYKSYSKFKSLQNEGKTILFVSHDQNAIMRHCDRAILLDEGRVLSTGAPKDIFPEYIDLLFGGKKSMMLVGDHKDFNIILFNHEYYALPRELGEIEPQEMEKIEGLMHAPKRSEVVKMINDSLGILQSDSLEEQSEAYDTVDYCPKRLNYNENEVRIGDRRAEILDFRLSSGKETVVTEIRSGETIDLSFKVVFHADIDVPLYGFSVNSVDGIQVFGTNTRLNSGRVSSMRAYSVHWVHLSIQMDLSPGDYFIDIGVGEKLPTMDAQMDTRRGLIFMKVIGSRTFDGFAKMHYSIDYSSQDSG